jgi:hypothetical protein
MPNPKSPRARLNPSASKATIPDARQKRAASPAKLIDARISKLGDWRGKLLSRLRALIRAADPDVLEEWKWNTPVWSHDGIICTGETYKQVVKMTFARGASLADPRACSIPASKARSGVPSTFAKATR